MGKNRIIFNPQLNQYRKIVPCYCGGEVHIQLLDRPRKKEQIINCYHWKYYEKDGWVNLGFLDV